MAEYGQPIKTLPLGSVIFLPQKGHINLHAPNRNQPRNAISDNRQSDNNSDGRREHTSNYVYATASRISRRDFSSPFVLSCLLSASPWLNIHPPVRIVQGQCAGPTRTSGALRIFPYVYESRFPHFCEGSSPKGPPLRG